MAYATYGYNAFEQLVSRATSAAGGPSGTVHYIHDRNGHIIAEADSSTGATAREYIWMAATPAPGLDPGRVLNVDDSELAALEGKPRQR